MSASTVSITANPATARRRSAVEKKSGIDLIGTDASPVNDKLAGNDTAGKDLSHLIRGETVLERSSRDAVQIKKQTLPSNSAALPRRTTRKGGQKAEKPRWQTVVSVFTKNLLLLIVLLGLVQMIRRLALNSGSVGPVVPQSSDFEGRMAEMESFLKTTTKMMQVQVEVVDRKIEKEIVGLRKELVKKIDDSGAEIGSQLERLDRRTESLEKSFAELSDKEWLAKEDFDRFFEEYKKVKGRDGGGEVNLDEVRAFARKIVEEEIGKHAADGLGMVDYALASGGAVVVKHSEPFIPGKVSSWFHGTNRNGVHSNADKMLRPSFGEPGECFPLKGNSGFVMVRLRTAIIPEAVTLEHVAKSVAYDRSSAPKDCRVSGMFGGQGTADVVFDLKKLFFLTQFTYDLEKSNAQTFSLPKDDSEASPRVVDTIRLDFTSNHGSLSHTCIYRLRVHGHEPNSVSALPTQS
ncbi:hypothetical protein LguiB_024126 [Lonicera macranthoides]